MQPFSYNVLRIELCVKEKMNTSPFCDICGLGIGVLYYL